jgi:hypothetical protein
MRSVIWLLPLLVLPACVLATSGTGHEGGSGTTATTTSSGGTSTGTGGQAVESSPTCFDGLRNGGESDVDCGGDACAPCAEGKSCLASADCRSGACSGGVCGTFSPACAPAQPGEDPNCNDCVQNGGESDVDCGGDACGPCDLGKKCAGDADCDSGACAGSVCVATTPGCVPPAAGEDPRCNDCVQNGGETDVDCGGDACGPCAAGQVCQTAGDCLSAACQGGRCLPGAAGEPCVAASDCESAQCQSGGCWTGLCCR